MARIQIPSGDTPLIKIESVAGSLQVKGWDEGGIRIDVDSEDHLDYSFKDDTLSLSCESDCMLRVPEGSELHIESLAGDAYVNGIEGKLDVDEVGGSLNLKTVGEATLGNVDGNLTARGVEGELNVKEVSGNLSLRDVEGEVTAKEIHGNLSLRNIEGNIKASSDGNAELRLELEEGWECRVKTGGNLFCHLEASSDADVVLTSGAEQIHLYTEDSKQLMRTGRHEFTLGDGGATLELSAEGHIDFRCRGGEEFTPDVDFVDDLAGLADEITEQVTTQMEGQLEALSEQLEALGERLKETGSRAAARAQRRVQEAQRRLEHKLRSRQGRVINVAPGMKTKSSEPVSSQERALILQMVQAKKISVQEAEMLLITLEGREAAESAPPVPPVPPVSPLPATLTEIVEKDGDNA
ncbi:MAG: hypothetical protein WEA61_10400 [Anaerolineales bacterium]